jgi:hypothetical protein
MVFSHNPELSKTALIRFYLRRHFSNFLPTGGKIAVMVFKGISHVDNDKAHVEGVLNVLSVNIGFFKSNPLIYFFL